MILCFLEGHSLTDRITIHILFTPVRLPDAERLRDAFIKNQVAVKLIDVADDQWSTLHSGKIFYFVEAGRYRQFARRVAAEVIAIEQFEIGFQNLTGPNVPTLAIWLVRRASTNVPAKKAPLTKILDTKISVIDSALVKCPNCPSSVRPDRLERHLLRHSQPRPPRRRVRGGSLAPYTKWPWQSQSGISRSSQKCRYCGKKAIYGDAVCYQCQR